MQLHVWALDELKERGGSPIVTPSVLQEMQRLAETAGDHEERWLAHAALANLNTWGVEPLGLNDVDHQIVLRAASVLIERNYFDAQQPAMILAEAAKLDSSLLLTGLEGEGRLVCLRDMNDLRLFLRLDRHLTDTNIVSPATLVEWLRKDLLPAHDPSI